MTIEEFKAGNAKANELNIKIQQAQGALEENKRQFEKLCKEFEAEYNISVTAENLDELINATLKEVTALAEEQRKAIADAEQSIYIEQPQAQTAGAQGTVVQPQAQGIPAQPQTQGIPAQGTVAQAAGVQPQPQVQPTPVHIGEEQLAQAQAQAPQLALFGYSSSGQPIQPTVQPNANTATGAIDFDKILGGKFGG